MFCHRRAGAWLLQVSSVTVAHWRARTVTLFVAERNIWEYFDCTVLELYPTISFVVGGLGGLLEAGLGYVHGVLPDTKHMPKPPIVLLWHRFLEETV